MIYPSIDKLLTVVDSKYTLVYVASNRSKQMIKNNYFQKPVNEYKSHKTIGRALEEIYDNLIHVDKRQ
jgi:DNA-directed RNA polymerase subunit omega